MYTTIYLLYSARIMGIRRGSIIHGTLLRRAICPFHNIRIPTYFSVRYTHLFLYLKYKINIKIKIHSLESSLLFI